MIEEIHLKVALPVEKVLGVPNSILLISWSINGDEIIQLIVIMQSCIMIEMVVLVSFHLKESC